MRRNTISAWRKERAKSMNQNQTLSLWLPGFVPKSPNATSGVKAKIAHWSKSKNALVSALHLRPIENGSWTSTTMLAMLLNLSQTKSRRDLGSRLMTAQISNGVTTKSGPEQSGRMS